MTLQEKAALVDMINAVAKMVLEAHVQDLDGLEKAVKELRESSARFMRNKEG